MNDLDPGRDPFSRDLSNYGIDGLVIKFLDWPDVHFSMQWEDAWLIYKVLQALGEEGAFHFVRAMDTLAERAYPEYCKPLDDEHFYVVWQAVEDILHTKEYKGKTEHEQLLHFTYVLERSRHITRDQAAAIASKVLQQPISTQAWRKRMERWIASKNLPKVGIRKRKVKTRL